MEPPEDPDQELDEFGFDPESGEEIRGQMVTLRIIKKEIDRLTVALEKTGYFDVRHGAMTRNEKEMFGNNSGRKLNEIIESVGCLPKKCLKVLDLCGGPGGFVLVLSNLLPKAKIVTCSKFLTNGQPTYDERCIASPKVVCLAKRAYGDIMDDTLVTVIQHHSMQYDLITADGSCDSHGNWAHQERCNSELLKREVLYCINLLRVGGTFVVKVFQGITADSACLYNILINSFVRVIMFKPPSSSVLSGEIYWVCIGFRVGGAGQPYDAAIVKAYFTKVKDNLLRQRKALRDALNGKKVE